MFTAGEQPGPAKTGSRSGGSSGGALFDFQPNSVVQGLDILEHAQKGSVSTGTRYLAWGETDVVAPGVTESSGFVFGRRYFSGLSDDGRGSTGARWVTSITERLVLHTAENGKRALQHFSWLQPYNDPDLWYVETGFGSNHFLPPASVGGEIRQLSANLYQLILRSGESHYFVDSPRGIRISERRDVWDNALTFVYQDPTEGYGYSAPTTDEDANAGLITVTDSRGFTWVIAIDALGYITSLTDPLGSIYYFSYDTVGATRYLKEVQYPARDVMEPNGSIVRRSPKREYTYEINLRLHEVIDDYGVVILENIYSPSHTGRVGKQRDATGGTYDFTEVSLSQTDVLTPKGWKQSFFHNGERQVTEIRQYVANFGGLPARSTNQSLYYSWVFERAGICNCGPVTKITEPDGGTIHLVHSATLDLLEVKKQSPDLSATLRWKWTYDAHHRITSFIPPEGNAAADPAPYTTTITRTISGTNQIRTRTIPARDWRLTPSIWTDVMDSKGRLLESSGPPHDGGAPSFGGKWSYQTQGPGIHLLHQVRQLDGATVSYTYQWDAGGRLTAIKDHADRQWSCTYDPEGRPLTWTAPTINGGQVYSHEWIYDGNGRLRRLRWQHFPDDSATSGPWIEWFFTYDAAGQILSEARQLDDASPTPHFAAHTWAYDQHGNVISATDPDGYTSTATYDERDLPWVMRDGVFSTEETQKTYEYNADGRLTVILERLDATHTVRFENEYDGLDRLTRYRIKNAADPNVQAGYVEVDYESGSRIQEMRTYGITGTTTRLVDKKSFLYEDFHDSPTRQTSYAYDLATGSQLRAVQSDFDYGASGLPLREYTGASLIAQYGYLTNGWPQSITDLHGNGLAITWDRYGNSLTETNTYSDPVAGVPLVTTRTFTRDQFGRATAITDSGAGVSSQSHTYVFDSSDNVVRHTGPDGSVQTYQYRFDGPMTRQDAVIGGSTVRAKQIQYTPGGLQHVVTDDRNNSVTYVYDGRGRLKQEVYPDGTTWTNVHNDAGLLTKITAPSGRTVDFTYDWRGMLAGHVYKDAAGTVKRSDVSRSTSTSRETARGACSARRR